MSRMSAKEILEEAALQFNRHLDECIQCREHPFNLCALGRNLLMAVGKAHIENEKVRNCLCIVGCSVNGNCPIHGEKANEQTQPAH
jgi:hypothetical protein